MEWPLSIALIVAVLLCAKLFQGSRAARKAHVAEQALRDSRIHEQGQVMAQQASQIRPLQPEISLLTEARDALQKRFEALSKYTHIEDVETTPKTILIDACSGRLPKSQNAES